MILEWVKFRKKSCWNVGETCADRQVQCETKGWGITWVKRSNQSNWINLRSQWHPVTHGTWRNGIFALRSHFVVLNTPACDMGAKGNAYDLRIQGEGVSNNTPPKANTDFKNSPFTVQQLGSIALWHLKIIVPPCFGGASSGLLDMMHCAVEHPFANFCIASNAQYLKFMFYDVHSSKEWFRQW